jgi:hypothetical protein
VSRTADAAVVEAFHPEALVPGAIDPAAVAAGSR